MRGFEPHRMHFRRLMIWHFFDWLFSNVLLMTSSCLFTFDASLSFRWLFLSLTTQTQVPWCASWPVCLSLDVPTLMLTPILYDYDATTWLTMTQHDWPIQSSTRQDKTRQDFSFFFNKWQQNTTIQDKTTKYKTRQQSTCKLPHTRDLTASIRARAV